MTDELSNVIGDW